ncbi:hypothetical protein Q5752_004667 [Cryptotrichosporon argae]
MDPATSLSRAPARAVGSPKLATLSLPTIPASGPTSRDDSPAPAPITVKRASSVYSDEVLLTPHDALLAPLCDATLLPSPSRQIAFTIQDEPVRRVLSRRTTTPYLPSMSTLPSPSRRRSATVGSPPQSPAVDALRPPVPISPRKSSLATTALGLTDVAIASLHPPPRSSSLLDQVDMLSSDTTSPTSSTHPLSSASTSLSRSTRSNGKAGVESLHTCGMAVIEIVETEVAYLDDLRTLQDVYLAELARMPGFANSFVAIGRHVAQLADLHQALADAMVGVLRAEGVDCVATAFAPGPVGRAASRIARLLLDQSFDAYTDFCAGSVATDATVRSLGDRADFQHYERRCEMTNATRARASLADLLGASAAPPSTSSPSNHARYHLADLLITPTQRICRYPLLLRRVADGCLEPAVGAALEHMARIAAAADAARRNAEAARANRLLLDRFEPHPMLSRSFLASLGTYHHAGPLDVVHWHPSVSPRVRCLGAILYDDYLVLAKVKRPYAYEPKHYFALSACVIKQGGLLPHSILFACSDHQIEVAAASADGLAVWLDALQAAQGTAVDRPSSFAPALARRQSADREHQRHIRRPSASQRHLVDRGLDDVSTTATWRVPPVPAPVPGQAAPATDARVPRRHSFFDTAPRTLALGPLFVDTPPGPGPRASAPASVVRAHTLRLRRTVSSYSLDTRPAQPPRTKSMPVSPVRGAVALPDAAAPAETASPAESAPASVSLAHGSPRQRIRRSLSVFRPSKTPAVPAEPAVGASASSSSSPATSLATTPRRTPRRRKSLLSVVTFFGFTPAHAVA